MIPRFEGNDIGIDMKHFNGIRKKYMILIIVALILVSIALVSKNITMFWFEMNVDMNCVKEKQSVYSNNYIPGYVVVWFKDDVSEQQATNLINQYGLLTDNVRLPSTRVYNLNGNEFKWLCILEKSELVDHASLAYRTRTLDG